MSIAEAYNCWAETYNDVPNKTRDLEARVIRESLEGKNLNNTLELGCGTGKNTYWLAERSKKLTALDFSEKMLEKAKQLDRENKINFQQADLNLVWPVPTEHFDLISCSLVLEHIENLDFIFVEAYRTLKKNSSFFICELHPFKQYLGSKARFENGNGTIELEVNMHHISDYIAAAQKSGFRIKKINESFDEDQKEIPRHISFIFEK
ncbi:Methyltransferase domain-containing protein [Salegentibacter holothuriorum]|uniref:Methyltransferase domain-containing protein n=1 Tax=Salegentibacter holothuriorum TaxID=241145 RepID=A0A1T5AYJ0_9FLAO|nr:class I SAM-dependent methyltransferase [Salegentibacter holothuriorum]SKB39857.1 Methyltransferase domain-containing protein [Salegentibacter holothuriorum]